MNPKIKVTGPATLESFLFQNLRGFKRTKIKQMLKFGSVRVNGRSVTLHRHPLKRGDVVDFLNKKEATLQQAKKKQPFRIVFEDAALIVVEKPAGLLTVGTEREKKKTLYYMLNEYARLESQGRKHGHILIVHRLDRDTSGFVVLAKTPAAQEKLQYHWPQAVKKYYAVVEGILQKKEGVIESELVEDQFQRVYSIRTPTEESKHAVTHYRVMHSGKTYTLVEATLETGRKNQIRVHFADRGHPIAGDAKYGAKTNPFNRLALHAGYLAINHPVTGARLTFGPLMPEPFKRFVNEK